MEEPAANLITFTIGGKSYQAEEGMTWGEFIASDFNTDQLVHGTTAEVYIKRSAGGSTTDTVMNSSNKAVMVTDLIEATAFILRTDKKRKPRPKGRYP